MWNKEGGGWREEEEQREKIKGEEERKHEK